MAKKGLGSGLDALFGGEAQLETAPELLTLPVAKVEPAPNQPRERFDPEKLQVLADSIAQHGVLQPIAVRRLNGGYYQIIAGERRWRAARLAGLSEIPARVVDVDDRDARVLALVENLQREDLNPMEQAKGLQALIDEFGFTQEDAAARVGCSRPAVSNALRLLGLPPAVSALVESGALSAGHARTLLPLEGEDRQLEAAELVIREGLSVRQTEQLVKRLLAGKAEPPAAGADALYVRALEERLTTQFSRKVRIVAGPKKGKLEIEYYGNEDLDRLLASLGASAAD